MALSALRATTLEAAAVQMRVISHYASRNDDALDRRLSALIFSVLGVLEHIGGFDRNRWAGEFYVGSQNAFEQLE